MTMQFAYPRYVGKAPVLAGVLRPVRPRPVIPLTLVGPSGTQLIYGLIDTGADDTVIPDHVAVAIGIDLTAASTGSSRGVGGSAMELRFVEIPLRIDGDEGVHEWTARVAFAPLGSRPALLGFAGFLQYFTACFHGDLEFVELTTNALYPGT